MRINSLLFAVLALPVGGVFASENSLPTVGELSAVQSETIMFDARAKRADAKAKMQENMTKAGDDQFVASPSAPSVVAADLPTVMGISGTAGRLFATFRYGNGTTVTAKSGEQIAGGFQVAEVGIDRVVLTRGDRRIPLQFGVADTPAQSAQMPMFGAPSPLPMR